MTNAITVHAAVLARLAKLNGMTQETAVPAEGGTILAKIAVSKMVVRFDLSWLDSDGVEHDTFPKEVQSYVADSDTDKLEEAIRSAFSGSGASVDVAVDRNCSSGSMSVEVIIESTADMGPKGNGGLRLVASSYFDEVGHHDGDSSCDVALATYVNAVKTGNGQLVTGYEEKTKYDGAALACARRLVSALGLA